LIPFWVPPPPPDHRVPQAETPYIPTTFVPFPTADPPEPVTERTPVIDYEGPTFDTPVLINDVAEPPRSPGLLRAGSHDVTNPVLIPDSKVAPDYPELARTVRIQGRVILEAVILRDGTVAEVSVLQCTKPDLGFEEAAIEAIRQWRYEPGRQNGVPVDVYFTVVVEFALQ
jgi:protein TonB